MVGAAVAAWLASAVTILGWQASPDPGIRRGVAIATVVLGLALLLVALLRLARRRFGQHPRTSGTVVLLAVAAAVLAAGVQAERLSADPVATAAATHAIGRLVAVIDGDPVTRSGRVSGSFRGEDRVTVPAWVIEVTVRGATSATNLPIRLLLPSDARAPEAGSTISALVRWAPCTTPTCAATATLVDDLAVRAPPPVIAATAAGIREGLRSALAGTDPAAGALVAGLSVGDESTQPEGLAEQMRASGLSHLTAVSGGNVAIVLLVVLGLARLVGLRRRGRLVVAALALIGFVVLVRPQPSVLRAAVMGAVVILALVVGGRRTAAPALAASVLILVVISPPLSVSVGFALSVLATAGLLWLAPAALAWLRRWRLTRRWPPALVSGIAVAAAAQVATAPIVAGIGGGLGLVAIPANLLAAPVVAPVTVLGLGAALVALPAPALAEVLAHIAAWFAGWIAIIARTASSLPLATLAWPEGVGGALLTVTAGVGAGALIIGVRRITHARRPVLLAIAVTAALALLVRPPSGWPPPGWVLVACSVGQGDGLVLRTGPARALVIDTGPDPGPIAGCLSDLGVTEVSAVVLSHFHVDHVGGLAGVLGSVPVGEIVVSALRDPLGEAERVERLADAAGVPIRIAAFGEVGRDGPATWRVLWPRRIIEESAPNNASVVLLVEVDGLRLLLTGDVEPPAQAALRAGLAPLQVDVAKVPHHGSRSIDPVFADWTGARIALVSVGAGNDYGHPAEETLAAWQAAGAVVGRTDTQGDLAVVRDETGALGLAARGNA